LNEANSRNRCPRGGSESSHRAIFSHSFNSPAIAALVKPLAQKARQLRCNDSRNRRPVATPSQREQRRTPDKSVDRAYQDKRTIDKRRPARGGAGSRGYRLRRRHRRK
jgi:phosphoenolpyruvate-protein kinase (PTS system EI component)